MRLATRNESPWLDLNAALHSICATAADVLGVDQATIWLLERDSEVLRSAAHYGREQRRRPENASILLREYPLYSQALQSERVIEAHDAESDPRLKELLDTSAEGVRAKSLVAASVRSSGKLAGVAVFEQLLSPREWQLDELAFAAGVADQVAQRLLDSQREQVLAEL